MGEPDAGGDVDRLIRSLDEPCRQDIEHVVARALGAQPSPPPRALVFAVSLVALTAIVALCVYSTVGRQPVAPAPMDAGLAEGMAISASTGEGVVWIGNVPMSSSLAQPGTGIVVWAGGTP